MVFPDKVNSVAACFPLKSKFSLKGWRNSAGTPEVPASCSKSRATVDSIIRISTSFKRLNNAARSTLLSWASTAAKTAGAVTACVTVKPLVDDEFDISRASSNSSMAISPEASQQLLDGEPDHTACVTVQLRDAAIRSKQFPRPEEACAQCKTARQQHHQQQHQAFLAVGEGGSFGDSFGADTQ